MKSIDSILVIILLLTVVPEGRGQKQKGNDGVITVNVVKSYSPKKELILQDFMDVEYIALETNDDFINQGIVLDVGKEFILVKNRNRINDGTIFVYDRNGKAIRKINRKGQGGEEYISLYSVTLDEESEEMFVNDILGKKIVVYDLYGSFKRSFKHENGIYFQFYIDVFNYDRHHLICYDENHEEIPFVLMSKQDGHIAHEIKIPFKEKKFLRQLKQEGNDGKGVIGVGPSPYYSIFPFNGNWVLSELSSDTVYTFLPAYSLRPFIVRTPPIQSMDPGEFLIIRLLSDRYYFMETIKNVYDWNTQKGFPTNYLVYDTKERSFSGYTVYNGDFTTKKEIYMSATKLVSHEIESWYLLEADQLVESYKKGELTGKLKETAATLNEESNPVIMLIKHKR